MHSYALGLGSVQLRHGELHPRAGGHEGRCDPSYWQSRTKPGTDDHVPPASAFPPAGHKGDSCHLLAKAPPPPGIAPRPGVADRTAGGSVGDALLCTRPPSSVSCGYQMLHRKAAMPERCPSLPAPAVPDPALSCASDNLGIHVCERFTGVWDKPLPAQRCQQRPCPFALSAI